MPLTLLQSQAIDKLVIELVDWLPGSSPWGSFTFADAAQTNQVGGYWPGGSKKRALTELLQRTYEHRRDRFCPLLVTIVQKGMSNRQQHGSPVTRSEMEHINGVVEQLSFKIPSCGIDRSSTLCRLTRRESTQPTPSSPIPRMRTTPDMRCPGSTIAFWP